jgi:hypothetical protein
MVLKVIEDKVIEEKILEEQAKPAVDFKIPEVIEVVEPTVLDTSSLLALEPVKIEVEQDKDSK